MCKIGNEMIGRTNLPITSSPTGFIPVEINVEGKGITHIFSTSFTTGLNPAGSHPKKFLPCIILVPQVPGLTTPSPALLATRYPPFVAAPIRWDIHPR